MHQHNGFKIYIFLSVSSDKFSCQQAAMQHTIGDVVSDYCSKTRWKSSGTLKINIYFSLNSLKYCCCNNSSISGFRLHSYSYQWRTVPIAKTLTTFISAKLMRIILSIILLSKLQLSENKNFSYVFYIGCCYLQGLAADMGEW